MAAATKKEKKRKEEAYPMKAGTSSGHITNLKQSILKTFDIYRQHGQLKGTSRQGQEHSTVVEHSTHNPKIEGSKLGERKRRKCSSRQWAAMAA
jgi:hypothetical protein